MELVDDGNWGTVNTGSVLSLARYTASFRAAEDGLKYRDRFVKRSAHDVEMQSLGDHFGAGDADYEIQDPADLEVDDVELLLRQQTLVLEQATVSQPILPMITYSIAVIISTALSTVYLVQLTDQTLLLILGALIALVFVQVLYWAIMHYSLPRSKDGTDYEDSLAAADDAVRKRIYQTIDRLAQSLLFVLRLLQARITSRLLFFCHVRILTAYSSS